jgi:hypothetical protein
MLTSVLKYLMCVCKEEWIQIHDCEISSHKIQFGSKTYKYANDIAYQTYKLFTTSSEKRKILVYQNIIYGVYDHNEVKVISSRVSPCSFGFRVT